MKPNQPRLRIFNPDAEDDAPRASDDHDSGVDSVGEEASVKASVEQSVEPSVEAAASDDELLVDSLLAELECPLLPLADLSASRLVAGGMAGTGAEFDVRPSAELEMVLNAWHTATERLQKTHEVLCGEVRRLTAELEVKNRELARKNRLADLGQMASHVAHEVRNGLSPVTLYLSWLRRRLHDDTDGLRILDKLQAGCLDVQTMVSDMLSFAADREPNWRRFSLPELIEELNGTLAPQYAAHRIQVHVEVPAIAMWADRDLLRRALVNLLLNAVDIMPQGGGIWISAYQNTWGCEIEVADSGPGLSEAAIGHLFEPFYTTKSEGSGLGLAIVQRVVEAHGGETQAKNCPEGGAAFTLRIPHRTMEAAA